MATSCEAKKPPRRQTARKFLRPNPKAGRAPRPPEPAHHGRGKAPPLPPIADQGTRNNARTAPPAGAPSPIENANEKDRSPNPAQPCKTPVAHPPQESDRESPSPHADSSRCTPE